MWYLSRVRLRKQGITIITILLMLGVLAVLVGAMVIAGRGNMQSEVNTTQNDLARYAAESGIERALADMTGPPATLPGTWGVPGAWTGANWQALDHGNGEFKIYKFNCGAATNYLAPGDPLNGVSPTIYPGPPVAGCRTILPAGTSWVYLLSVGRYPPGSPRGRVRQLGVMLQDVLPPRILSRQLF